MTKADKMFEELGYENLEDKTMSYCMYLYAKGENMCELIQENMVSCDYLEAKKNDNRLRNRV